MMAAILGWKLDEVLLDSDRSGKIVESWVYNQIAPLADFDPDCSIKQFRDNRKRKIDFVVGSGDGRTLGVEVKAGSQSEKAISLILHGFAKPLPTMATSSALSYTPASTRSRSGRIFTPCQLGSSVYKPIIQWFVSFRLRPDTDRISTVAVWQNTLPARLCR